MDNHDPIWFYTGYRIMTLFMHIEASYTLNPILLNETSMELF